MCYSAADFELGFRAAVAVAVADEREPAVGAAATSVERWPIEMTVVPAAAVQQRIERGFGSLVERGRRLVQEQEIRRLQDGARNPEPLLLAERERPVPVTSSCNRPASAGSPTAAITSRKLFVVEGAAFSAG